MIFLFFSSSLACLEPELELFEVWEINVRQIIIIANGINFKQPNASFDVIIIMIGLIHLRSATLLRNPMINIVDISIYHHDLQEPDAGINLHSFLQSVRRGK